MYSCSNHISGERLSKGWKAGGKNAADALLLQGAGSEDGTQLSTKSLSQELVYKSRGEKGRIKALFCRGAQFDATPLKAQNATSLHVCIRCLLTCYSIPAI